MKQQFYKKHEDAKAEPQKGTPSNRNERRKYICITRPARRELAPMDLGASLPTTHWCQQTLDGPLG